MRIGAHISLYPMTDRFVETILPAVDAIGRRDDLEVVTDDVSTLILGEAAAVFAAARDAFAAAAIGGVHVVLNALFSRGCPGDSYCTSQSPDRRENAPASTADASVAADLTASDDAREIETAAQFALYPLGLDTYMDEIYRAIEATRTGGATSTSKNFCTRLDGTANAIFRTLYRSFIDAAAAHVVVHATVSANSPSTKGGTTR